MGEYIILFFKKIINLIDISDGIIRKRNCFQDSGDFSLHYLKIWTNSLSMSFRYYNLSPSLSLSFTLFFFFKKKIIINNKNLYLFYFCFIAANMGPSNENVSSFFRIFNTVRSLSSLFLGRTHP